MKKFSLAMAAVLALLSIAELRAGLLRQGQSAAASIYQGLKAALQDRRRNRLAGLPICA